jgi:hypothetical protein
MWECGGCRNVVSAIFEIQSFKRRSTCFHEFPPIRRITTGLREYAGLRGVTVQFIYTRGVDNLGKGNTLLPHLNHR